MSWLAPSIRRVLVCLVVAAAALVTVPPTHTAEPVVVNYHDDLAKLTVLARYPVVAPRGLPRLWQPVSTDLAVGGGNGPGTVTWYLGFWTPTGTLASLAETNATSSVFVHRMSNGGTPQPQPPMAGRTWQALLDSGRNQRTLYRTGAAGSTLLVTGDATWTQLRHLAASLQPVR